MPPASAAPPVPPAGNGSCDVPPTLAVPPAAAPEAVPPIPIPIPAISIPIPIPAIALTVVPATPSVFIPPAAEPPTLVPGSVDRVYSGNEHDSVASSNQLLAKIARRERRRAPTF